MQGVISGAKVYSELGTEDNYKNLRADGFPTSRANSESRENASLFDTVHVYHSFTTRQSGIRFSGSGRWRKWQEQFFTFIDYSPDWGDHYFRLLYRGTSLTGFGITRAELFSGPMWLRFALSTQPFWIRYSIGTLVASNYFRDLVRLYAFNFWRREFRGTASLPNSCNYHTTFLVLRRWKARLLQDGDVVCFESDGMIPWWGFMGLTWARIKKILHRSVKLQVKRRTMSFQMGHQPEAFQHWCRHSRRQQVLLRPSNKLASQHPPSPKSLLRALILLGRLH